MADLIITPGLSTSLVIHDASTPTRRVAGQSVQPAATARSSQRDGGEPTMEDAAAAILAYRRNQVAREIVMEFELDRARQEQIREREFEEALQARIKARKEWQHHCRERDEQELAAAKKNLSRGRSIAEEVTDKQLDREREIDRRMAALRQGYRS
jgi:hypothetical protein